MQDYDRAILVGQKTFGKGLVQTTRQLSYNAQLKVTTAKYYIPSGRCIQALDYTHRKKDGTVEKFADSLKAEFKTKGGRKVFDGGGLDPDVAIANEFLGSVSEELITSGFIFEYANKYCGEHPEAPINMKNFKLTDAEYSKFTTWLEEKNFKYATELEKQTEKLIETAKAERHYDELQNQLLALKSKIDQNHSTDFTRFKDEISKILEGEIAFHYRLVAGQTEISLDNEPEIVRARKMLSDNAAYRKLLSPN